MELGSDMEYLYQSLAGTRLKRIIEIVLSVLFPVRDGSLRAACHRQWWEDYESRDSIDPFRPFERGDEGAKSAKEGSFETPMQRRSRVFMSPLDRDIKRKADAAGRQATERNYGRAEIPQLSGEELDRSQTNNETNSLRTSVAD